MAAAGIIAQLVRKKAIEAIPTSYRITEIGRSILVAPPTTAESPSEAAKEQQEQPKKGKRKSKKEPQNEPSSGQGEQSP